MRRTGLPLLLAACWVLLTPHSAQAYEDQLGLSVDAIYGRVVPTSAQPNGLLLGATGSLGLDDIWTVRARLAYGAQLATDESSDATELGLASAELLYVFDILAWVPYFGLGADLMVINQINGLGTEAGGHFVVGLDWLATRELCFGLDVRGITLLSQLDQRPFYLAVTLSAGWLLPL